MTPSPLAFPEMAHRVRLLDRRAYLETKSGARTPAEADELRAVIGDLRELDAILDRAPDAWPRPQPLTHSAERHPVPAFDPAWLPAGVRAWVADVAHRMQISADFPAVAAMVMLSACVGRRVAVRPKQRDNWTVVPNLWGLIVGRPGLMKSPVLKQITAPLQRLHVEAQRAHGDALQAHDASLLAFEAQKSAVREAMKRRLKSNPSADVSDLALDLVPPDPPSRTEYVIYDATPEALVETARDNPAGFLHLRDELAGLIARLSAPTAGEERALYLATWNGDQPFAQKRIGRGYVAAEALCQSLLGGIQPGKLTDLTRGAMRGGMDDDGLLQRFQLMVQPDLPADFVLVDEWPNGEAKREAYTLVSHLATLDGQRVGAEQDTGFDGEPEGVPFLRFAPDAQAMFNDWLTGLERRLRAGTMHPAIESHLSKYRSLVPSLALLLHLADGETGAVSSSALARALVWVDYLEAHALRIYGMAATPAETGARQLARRIIDGDLAGPDGVERFTVRELYRRGWSGLASKEEAQAAVDVLTDLAWLRCESETKGRRTYTEYRVSPRVAWTGRAVLLPGRHTASAVHASTPTAPHVPRRDPPLTHRHMLTHERPEAHTSASVSASVLPHVPEDAPTLSTEAPL
ncbi:MAG: YfjI family protein [Bacteroidota bacterium]